MKNIIISDTHSPHCLQKAYNFLVEILPANQDIDAIVINGDIIGVFSMNSAKKHKEIGVSEEDKMNYLEQSAPKFYQKWLTNNKHIEEKMIIEYVEERYEWAYKEIKKFSKLKETIFNMGNHESPLHFLVLQEIPFLTGCTPQTIYNFDKNKLKHVFEKFEEKLYQLEKEEKFKYIRNDFHIINGIMIFGIPGESHATTGLEPESIAQEEKTKKLITQAELYLPFLKGIIIYNHTQGDYDRTTGAFQSASPNLNKFMKEIPKNITKRVFVQSHNHWRHTQFLKNPNYPGFEFILNNAGLHEGIFNMVVIEDKETKCYDFEPDRRIVSLLKIVENPTPTTNWEDLIKRNYVKPENVIGR